MSPKSIAYQRWYYANKRIECDCGRSVAFYRYQTHLKTDFHREWTEPPVLESSPSIIFFRKSKKVLLNNIDQL